MTDLEYCPECGEVFAPRPGVPYCRAVDTFDEEGKPVTEYWCIPCADEWKYEAFWVQEGGIE